MPIQDKKITDRSRIEKIIPVIKELISKKAKIILISHLGRPKGKIDQKLSLKPIASLKSKYPFLTYGNSKSSLVFFDGSRVKL